MQLQHNDPIFVAIDLYQNAKAKWLAVDDVLRPQVYNQAIGKVIDCACDAAAEAWHVLASMTPATPAGFVAKLQILAAEDLLELDAEDVLQTIFDDFAALAGAAPPVQVAASRVSGPACRDARQQESTEAVPQGAVAVCESDCR
jgi:hypothetical protein